MWNLTLCFSFRFNPTIQKICFTNVTVLFSIDNTAPMHNLVNEFLTISQVNILYELLQLISEFPNHVQLLLGGRGGIKESLHMHHSSPHLLTRIRKDSPDCFTQPFSILKISLGIVSNIADFCV